MHMQYLGIYDCWQCQPHWWTNFDLEIEEYTWKRQLYDVTINDSATLKKVHISA